MSRNLILALIVSLLLHGGAAVSGYLVPEPSDDVATEPEIPTIALDMPPPPEPDEPEIMEDVVSSDEPVELADIAPPMQNDVPSAVIDSPFVQQLQAPPPPGLNRPTGGNIVIPTATRPSLGGGKGLGNIFDLAALDQRPEARVRINPVYPFEMRRSGLRGDVIVGFIVDSEGNVRDPYIVRSSNPGFEQAAIDAVLKWKFRPGKKGGANVSTRVQQPLAFTLNNE
jgi:protein TonB